jgi:nucleoside-diphosphate-sugar epimerase
LKEAEPIFARMYSEVGQTMRVLVTGNLGYIGPVVVSALAAEGHNVTGLDTGLYEGSALEQTQIAPTLAKDVRDVTRLDLDGCDAVIHLAALSNDPLGLLDPALTMAINLDATVRLAELARDAGVQRFLLSSSCSVYGAAADEWVDESTPAVPITPYGESKLRAEQALVELSTSRFCVVSLRNATAFGYSPNFRTDIVVNDLVAGAILKNEVRLLSDGSAWRPLVHIRDIAGAFVQALSAPAASINGAVLNVGADEQNYTIKEVAARVVGAIPGAKLVVADPASRDRRSYRVRFARLKRVLPDFHCSHDLANGIEDLVENLRRVGLQSTDGCVRLDYLRRRLQAGAIDADLRPSARVMEPVLEGPP